MHLGKTNRLIAADRLDRHYPRRSSFGGREVEVSKQSIEVSVEKIAREVRAIAFNREAIAFNRREATCDQG